MEGKATRNSEAPVAVAERRAVLRVLQHWRRACGARDFPARQDIDPAAIASDWRSSFIVDLFGRNGVPSFGYIGDALQIAPWGDGVGARVTDCPPGTILAIATNYMGNVIESRLPVSHSGSALHDGHVVLFRSILLPLSADGARIDAILGTANFRRVEPSRLVIVDED
jgi:hypothetical protein